MYVPTRHARTRHALILTLATLLTGCARDSQFAQNEQPSWPVTPGESAPPASVAPHKTAGLPEDSGTMLAAAEDSSSEVEFGVEQPNGGVVHAMASPKASAELFAPFETPQKSPVAQASAKGHGTEVMVLGSGESLASKLTAAKGPVLVDFFADWCGPCRRQSTVLHEVAAMPEIGDATIIKVNVDEHPKIAAQYSVGSLPTLITVRDGSIVNRKLGLTDKSQILTMLQK